MQHSYLVVGTAVVQWLRCCTTNRKVAGSIPACVIDIKSFQSHYGPGVDSALTEMSTRSISWGIGGRCVRLTTLPTSCAVVMKCGNLNFLEPSGTLQLPGCSGTVVYLMCTRRFAETFCLHPSRSFTFLEKVGNMMLLNIATTLWYCMASEPESS